MVIGHEPYSYCSWASPFKDCDVPVPTSSSTIHVSSFVVTYRTHITQHIHTHLHLPRRCVYTSTLDRPFITSAIPPITYILTPLTHQSLPMPARSAKGSLFWSFRNFSSGSERQLFRFPLSSTQCFQASLRIAI